MSSLQTSAHSQKEAALEQFEEHNYEEALKLLKLALLLHPKDSSGLKFRRFVESHQAAAYFKLKKYGKALEVGETSYWSNSSQKSTVRPRIRLRIVEFTYSVTTTNDSKIMQWTQSRVRSG